MLNSGKVDMKNANAKVSILFCGQHDYQVIGEYQNVEFSLLFSTKHFFSFRCSKSTIYQQEYFALNLNRCKY